VTTPQPTPHAPAHRAARVLLGSRPQPPGIGQRIRRPASHV